jgi:hypothetical protein
MKVYRDEDYIVFESINLPNGKNLAQELQELAKSNNKAAIENLTKNINDNRVYENTKKII